MSLDSDKHSGSVVSESRRAEASNARPELLCDERLQKRPSTSCAIKQGLDRELAEGVADNANFERPVVVSLALLVLPLGWASTTRTAASFEYKDFPNNSCGNAVPA